MPHSGGLLEVSVTSQLIPETLEYLRLASGIQFLPQHPPGGSSPFHSVFGDATETFSVERLTARASSVPRYPVDIFQRGGKKSLKTSECVDSL